MTEIEEGKITNLRMLVLDQKPLFPGGMTTLVIQRAEEINMIEDASKDSTLFGVVLSLGDKANLSLRERLEEQKRRKEAAERAAREQRAREERAAKEAAERAEAEKAAASAPSREATQGREQGNERTQAKGRTDGRQPGFRQQERDGRRQPGRTWA